MSSGCIIIIQAAFVLLTSELLDSPGWICLSCSFGDAIFEMRQTGPRDRADRLELYVTNIEIVEKAPATAEQKRNDVNFKLIDETCGEILLGNVGSADERHIFTICCAPGLLERRLDAIGDEKECRASLHRQWFARVMGEHEHGLMVWRIVAPPTVPSWLAPCAASSAEHVSAHDRRANDLQRFAAH